MSLQLRFDVYPSLLLTSKMKRMHAGLTVQPHQSFDLQGGKIKQCKKQIETHTRNMNRIETVLSGFSVFSHHFCCSQSMQKAAKQQLSSMKTVFKRILKSDTPSQFKCICWGVAPSTPVHHTSVQTRKQENIHVLWMATKHGCSNFKLWEFQDMLLLRNG